MPRNNAGCGAKCCPYGHTFAAPCILGVLAMVSTYSATFSCHLLDTNAVFNGKKVDFFVGPWTVEDFKISSTGDVDYEDCVGWDEHDLVSTSLLDAPARFSRSISMIGCFAAFIFWVVLMFSSCCVFDSFVFNSMIPVFGLAAITSILTLVLMASDVCDNGDDCHVAGSGVSAIVAFPLWIATAAVLPCMKEKEVADPDIEEMEEQQQVEKSAGGVEETDPEATEDKPAGGDNE